MAKVIVGGTLALDYIKTPNEEYKNLLGGSGSYTALSASHYGEVELVGVIGEDFPNEHKEIFESRKIGLCGVEQKKGKCLNWGGEYRDAMNQCETLWTELNVLENWEVQLPEELSETPILVLANMHPKNQMELLNKMSGSQLVLLDTMNFWLSSERELLGEVVKRADILVLNHAEACDYAGSDNLILTAEALLEKGSKFVIIKLGEFGSLLATKAGEQIRMFRAPAWPLKDVKDPTGAGDSFLGALAGKLARDGVFGLPSFEQLKQALLYASATASFTCQSFSIMGLESATLDAIEERVADIKQLIEI